MAEKKSEIQETELERKIVSTTETTPSKADETSEPGPYNPGQGGPKLNQPPVRTNRPDVPIAQALAAGAGEHTPPDESEVGPDGRPVYDEAKASKAEPAENRG